MAPSVYTELLYVNFCWSMNTGVSIGECCLWVHPKCQAYLAPLTWTGKRSKICCEMGGKWPYSCCFVGCCFKNLFKAACSIFVQFLCSFFMRVQVVLPYSSTDMVTAWKSLCLSLILILSINSERNIIISNLPYWVGVLQPDQTVHCPQ